MKRFYKAVAVEPAQGAWQVKLDGRAIKTQGGKAQLSPTQQLADAMAREWDEQGEELDPRSFQFRDLTDYAIDKVAPAPQSTIDKLVAYAETDTLCYRADPDEALYERQQQVWEPILTRIEAREGVRFTRISGIMHQAQPNDTLTRLRASLEQFDPFLLAGLQTLSSLATSFGIGLEALQNEFSPGALWDAANLEELWQEELWGVDTEAQEHRTQKGQDFLSAFEWVQAARA